MQNIFETSTELSQEGGVTCKFSKKLSGDGDRDDINLGADGGVFIFADGKDMGSDKKYEFFPEKVDFGEYRMPSHDGGTDDDIDDQQEKNKAEKTDSLAFEDQYQESEGTEAHRNSQETGVGLETDDIEEDKNIAGNTDSMAFGDEYQESAANEADIKPQDIDKGKDLDSKGKEPNINSQQTGPGQTDDIVPVDTEKDDNIPPMTDSMALDDEYQESTGKENDTNSQDIGLGQTDNIELTDEVGHLDRKAREPNINSQETGLDQTDDVQPVDTEKDENIPPMTDSMALDDEYQEITAKENDTKSQDIGLGQTDNIELTDEEEHLDNKGIEPNMNSQETGLDQTDDVQPVDTEKDDVVPPMTDSIALDDEYQESTGKENNTKSQDIGLEHTDDIELIDEEHGDNIADMKNRNQSQDMSLGHADVLGPVEEYGTAGESEIGQVGIPFQCDGNTNGYRFLHLPKTFTKFIECDKGVFYKRDCPRASLFFVTLQCCINYAKFPCRQNCAN